MRVIVAMDSFKGSMDAPTACAAAARGLLSVRPDWTVRQMPVADGGEGTARAVLSARPDGQWIPATVTGPFPDMQVEAGYAFFPADKTAVIEMAAASGLILLAAHELNPMKTTTFGTGQLIEHALQHGADKLLVTVGGSATVDGGTGAAAALGWKFYTAEGACIEMPTGGDLNRIVRMEPPDQAYLPDVKVLCDVDNPLTGEHGAAAVYAPQKGADEEMTVMLENGLVHLADLMERDIRVSVASSPGSGAAGGLAAGLMAFLNGRLVSGIQEIMRTLDFESALAAADWVITGEGRFDHQSLRGKVVSGIAGAASAAGVQTAVLAGTVNVSDEELKASNVALARAAAAVNMPLEEALRRAEELLEKAAGELVPALEAE